MSQAPGPVRPPTRRHNAQEPYNMDFHAEEVNIQSRASPKLEETDSAAQLCQ